MNELYTCSGRPSIPSEQLLRVLLLQAIYSLRSERLLLEQLDYNMLLSNKRFSVDGTLLQVWASHGSLKPVAGQGFGKDKDSGKREKKPAKLDFQTVTTWRWIAG